MCHRRLHVLLCGFVHRLVHRNAYRILLSADGRPRFQRPDRTAIPLAGASEPNAFSRTWPSLRVL
jgi:hypothetical protein